MRNAIGATRPLAWIGLLGAIVACTRIPKGTEAPSSIPAAEAAWLGCYRLEFQPEQPGLGLDTFRLGPEHVFSRYSPLEGRKVWLGPLNKPGQPDSYLWAVAADSLIIVKENRLLHLELVIAAEGRKLEGFGYAISQAPGQVPATWMVSGSRMDCTS